MGPLHWLRQGDGVTQATALLLLAMSVASWVVMLWKLRLMQRARRDVARATAAFWQAPDWDSVQQQVAAFDREALVLPLADAAKNIATSAGAIRARASFNPLSAQASLGQQLTRVLRDALHAVLGKLQFGQVLLASSIRLELPRTEGAVPGTAPQSVTVVVDKVGQAFINDEPLAQSALAQRFITIAAEHPGTEVQLRADAAVPYGRVVAIMGAAHQAGLTRIGFVAEPLAAPPP